MSSKVLTGQAAADAPSIAWRKVAAEPTQVWIAKAPAAITAPGAQKDCSTDPAVEARIAELERRVREARQDGQREGEAAGMRRAAEQLEPVLSRFAKTIEELVAFRIRFRREAEQDLVRLALSVAKRILRRELAIDSSVMLGLVKAALDQLELRETYRVRMHPQDAPAIQQRFRDLGLPSRLEVVADAGLERGAVIFETIRGEMDASIDTQLAEISRGLADLVERQR
jgi:flagellar assembly protein FliH